MCVVARGSVGELLLSAWDFIPTRSSAEEAELRACPEDLYTEITLHRPITLETDCLFVYWSIFFLMKLSTGPRSLIF